MIDGIIPVFQMIWSIFSVILNILDTLNVIYNVGWFLSRCAAMIYSICTGQDTWR